MKTETKQRFKSAVSILLMLAVVITGAFAYFTATDSKKNVFTLGDVDIVLHEDDWTEPDENGDSQHIDGDNLNILPGDKITKAPYIENTGDNNAWVYMTIGIPTIQRDTSRADDLAISFKNTNIPVEAYALQEGYGNVDGSQAMWDAYFADKSDDKFGTVVTDETALLNRVELFNMPNLGSGWTQLGEVFKSEDGFNYYVFAYNNTVEPTAKTTPVIEWVQLNPALTQNEDVLFSPDDAIVDYFARNDIGESAAQEIYGAQADYEYAGAIEPDYVPEQDDAYYVSNAGAMLTFNATSSQWEVESTEENPVDEDLIPDSILNQKTQVVISNIIVPEPDPAPNLEVVNGTVWEDDYYIYKYNNLYSSYMSNWVSNTNLQGWGARVKDPSLDWYPTMKSTIGGKPVTCGASCYSKCTNLIEAPVQSINLTNMGGAFENCTSLTTAPVIPENVTNLSTAFKNCSSLLESPIIPDKVDNISGAFSDCTSLTTASNVPSSVTQMGSTFQNCKALVQLPDMSKATNVTNMASAFEGCTLITETPDLSNCSKLDSLQSTFKNCSALTKVSILPDSISNLRWAFQNCTSLTKIDNIPMSAELLYATFSGCKKLATIPNIIPDSVTDMMQTFMNCSSLTVSPQISSSVTTMDGTFNGCSSLTKAPDLSKATKLTNMSLTFNKCSSLTETPVVPNSVTNMYSTFNGCSLITKAPTLPNGITNLQYTFSQCASLTEAPVIPESVTDMTGTFSSCASLITAPALPKNLLNMQSTFSSCEKLTAAPVIPESVTNMQSAFEYCTTFTEFPTIPNSVTNMYRTFYGCANIGGNITIPRNVTLMDYCLGGIYNSITMNYYSGCTVAANYKADDYSQVTKVCIDA